MSCLVLSSRRVLVFDKRVIGELPRNPACTPASFTPSRPVDSNADGSVRDNDGRELSAKCLAGRGFFLTAVWVLSPPESSPSWRFDSPRSVHMSIGEIGAVGCVFRMKVAVTIVARSASSNNRPEC